MSTDGCGRRCTCHTRWARGDFDLIHNHLDWRRWPSPRSAPRPWSPRSTASRRRRTYPLSAVEERFRSISDSDRSTSGTMSPPSTTGSIPHRFRSPRRAGGPRVLRAHQSRQGGRLPRSRSPSAPAGDSCSAGLCRTRATSASWSSRTWMVTACAPSGSVGPGERAAVLGGAACCSTRSRSRSLGLWWWRRLICGTPVVAYPRGSMPEIVEEDVTGALVGDVAGAAAAVDEWPASTAPYAARPRCGASVPIAWVESYVRVYEGSSVATSESASPGTPATAPVSRALALSVNAVDGTRAPRASRTEPSWLPGRGPPRFFTPRMRLVARRRAKWIVDEEPALAYDGSHPEEEWGSRTPRDARGTSSMPGSSPTPPSAPAARGSPWQDLRFPQLRAPGVAMTPEDRTGCCCRGESTCHGCSFTARPRGRPRMCGFRVPLTSGAGARRSS